MFYSFLVNPVPPSFHLAPLPIPYLTSLHCFQRAEEMFPAMRETMMSVLCMWAQKRILLLL
jgi:hypothetical protein